MKHENTSPRKGAKPDKKTEKKNRPANKKAKISQDRWGREGDFPIESVMVNTREINEQERMEGSLKNERDRLESILNSMTDGVYIVNQQYGIEYANPAMEREFGPFEGRECHEYLAGERQPCSWCTWPEILAGNTIRVDWMCTRNGKIYDSIDTPLQNPDGTLSKLKIIRDITKRQRLEQALRESQKDLNRAQAVAHTGSWRLDVRRNVLLWSDETHRIFGIPKGAPMTYETFLATVHPEDREYVDQQWQAALRGEPYDIEHRIVVDGAVKWVRERSELEFDKEGALLGGFGTAQDITEHRQAEEAIRRAKEEWERTFDAVPDLVAIIDNEHGIVRVNEAMADRLGLKPEQCIGLKCYEAVHGVSHPAAFCPFVHTLQDGQQHIAEVHEPRLGGDFLVSTTPLSDAQGELIGSVHVARDITERKQAVEALRRLSQFPQENPNPVLRVAPDGALLYANTPARDWLATLGWEAEGPLPPPVHAVVAEACGRDHAIETEITNSIGRTFSITAVQPSGEDYINIYGLDITNRKQAEEALRELKDQLEVRVQERTAELSNAYQTVKEQSKILEAFFSSTVTPLVFLDRNFNFIRVNEAYAKACQRDVSEFPGHNHFEFYPSDAKEIFEQVVETREPYQVIARPFTFPDHPEWGVTYWNWTLTPILDEADEVEFLVFSLEDVTERRRAEEELRQSEARYRSLFEDSRDPVYIVTRDGTFVDFNKAMIDLLGYSREELMDKNIRDLYVNPNEGPRFQRSIERKGSVKHYEMRFRRKNGRVRECLITASLRRAEDGTILGYQGIIRDITRQRRYQRVLQNYVERLRALSQKLLDAQENERRLIARDLHDSIGGSLSAIKFSLGRKLDQMNKGEFSKEISLENIISMIQRTIDENRRIMTELRPSLLDDLGILKTIDWFCREFEGVYSDVRIEKQVEIEEGEIPEHLKIVIFRILQETMNNVAKHSGGNFACISFTKRDSSLELTITDNGQGFDTKRLVAKEVGGGIGLPGMRERVQLSGGTFSIKSDLEGGTTVKAKWEIKNN